MTSKQEELPDTEKLGVYRERCEGIWLKLLLKTMQWNYCKNNEWTRSVERDISVLHRDCCMWASWLRAAFQIFLCPYLTNIRSYIHSEFLSVTTIHFLLTWLSMYALYASPILTTLTFLRDLSHHWHPSRQQGGEGFPQFCQKQNESIISHCVGTTAVIDATPENEVMKICLLLKSIKWIKVEFWSYCIKKKNRKKLLLIRPYIDIEKSKVAYEEMQNKGKKNTSKNEIIECSRWRKW